MKAKEFKDRGGKRPYTYFSDIIIGETTCDGKKKMYELLNEIKETYVLHLPQSQEREYAKDIWYEEIKLFKEKLEQKFGVEITEENLRRAAHTRNNCGGPIWRCTGCRRTPLRP